MPVNQKHEYLSKLLISLKFENDKNIYTKKYLNGAYLKIDFEKELLIYPTDLGFKVNGEFTTNFSSSENFVVFECVDRLFEKGYKPENIELEPKWKLGHAASGGRADIFIRDQNNKPLLIIECKTADYEFDKAWVKTQEDGDQLFSYIEQEKDVKFVCLYASALDDASNVIKVSQKIISHCDNRKILEEDTNLLSFADAKNVKERYKVWRDTYNLEYTETGIFEDNVQAYLIGKEKYTLAHDTKPIGSTDKKGKHKQFEDILRKYNVSRKENAFEVLVNLFLCKIVDETLNPTDLKFYWKGIAYDNYFDFVDRLQELYQKGMEKYLEQEITYVSNVEIDGAFWAYSNKKNATRVTIKELFKKLKFFNDNNFAFIGIKNKKGFEKNAKILLEVTRMWQGVQLKTKEQNQFLGDMFEFFLDSGVKQSEGQYFTPVPICKFILNCLPLESMVKGRIEPLKTIDYACGSGHFLTEYSHQIESIANQNNQNPADFYHNVYGIEKEDRLAKVSKVSAFMYGFDGINIIDADALVSNPKIKEESFDILIANPPFAVKDFLSTIPEDERLKFELTDTVSNQSTNDDIQNFFLERAKQLMTAGGVAGIVIPNTILTNTDKISIQTREILLRYFNFISIVELPSATFGKTGTNTVVLYLERKTERPEIESHYQNRIDSWFENQDFNNSDYQDKKLLEAYCEHCEFKLSNYITLLEGKPSSELLELELFVEYKSSFDNLTETKNHIKSRNYTSQSGEKQGIDLNKKFIKYLSKIEKDKLYYFVLAYNNPRSVLIVRSPSDNKLAKKFLGYEWSDSKSSKGKGIRYNGGDTVHDVITEMFNPKDRDDKSKISYLVRQNFIETNDEIPTNLTEFCQYHSLTNLIDFSRTSFDKAINLTPKKSNSHTEIKSKWEMVKLGDETDLITKGTTPTSVGFEFVENGINFVKIESIDITGFINKDKFAFISEKCNKHLFRSQLKENDILFSIAGALGRATIVDKSILPANTNQALALIRLKHDSKLKLNYLYQVLRSPIIQELIDGLKVGVAQPNLSLTQINSFKIPLPPLEIQNQIVAECEVIEQGVIKAKNEIEKLKSEIEEKINLKSVDKQIKKLGEIININLHTLDPKNNLETEFIYIDIDSIGKGNGIINYEQRIIGNNLPSRARRVVKSGNTIISTVRPNLKGFAFIEKEVENIIFSTGFAVLETKNKEILLDKIIFYYFLYSNSLMKQMENAMPKGLYPSINKSDIENLQISLPSIEIQNQIIAEIEIIEVKIIINQSIIDSSKKLKQEILDKHLI